MVRPGTLLTLRVHRHLPLPSTARVVLEQDVGPQPRAAVRPLASTA
jgi:hypothetical protein